MFKVSARPLLDNSVDADLFVGRTAERAAVQSALNRELSVLLTGGRGSGKTSLLRQLQLDSRTAGSGLVGDFPMRYVRAEGVRDGRVLLARIVETVIDDPVTVSGNASALDLLEVLAQWRESVVSATRERWRAGGSEPSGVLSPVVLVDDVTAVAGHALFGQFRDEVWDTGLLWVVSARESERAGLLMPPADVFFEKVVDLGPLGSLESVALLDARAGRALGPAAERLAEAVGGNPRNLVAALRGVLDDPESGAAMVAAIGERDTAMDALGRPEAMLAAELKVRGPVSASDASLLSSLGWTRPRAAQVFAKLLEGGFVVVREQPASGPGRPRKIYELTPPEEWRRAREITEAPA